MRKLWAYDNLFKAELGVGWKEIEIPNSFCLSSGRPLRVPEFKEEVKCSLYLPEFSYADIGYTEYRVEFLPTRNDPVLIKCGGSNGNK